MDLSSIPQCGLECIVLSLNATTCTPTNTTCLCTDEFFGNVVAACVQSSCTIRDQLRVMNGTASNCGRREPDPKNSLIAITVVLIALQTIFFVLRMLCRIVRIAPWGWDDTTIVMAFILTTSFIAGSVLEQGYGLGRNIWTVEPDKIDLFLQVFLAFEAIYVCVLALIKISICFLYLRIFPGRRFRIAVWATQLFNVALAVGFLITEGFQCRPITFFWQGWDGEHVGYCWNLEAYIYSHAAINIALDAWILVLPSYEIWRLNLPFKKKLGVFAMFGFGIALTLVSILRLLTLRGFAHSRNATSDFYGVAVWTAVEVTTGLMVACMPAARLFVMYAIRRLRGKQSQLTSTTPYYPRKGQGYGNGRPTPLRSLSKRMHQDSSSKSLDPKDLDKNRDYSMSVTVTSNKNFLDIDDLHLAEDGGGFMDFLPQPGSATLSPNEEQFGLPDGSLTPGGSQKERSRRILVTQDVSVSNRSSESPRFGSDDDKVKAEHKDW